MIKSINSSSDFLMVNGGSPSPNYLAYSNVQNELRVTGNLRYNANTSNYEVYDGNQWQIISQANVNIDLTTRTKEILTWAEYKMHEEKKLQELMERHPGLRDLHNKLEMMKVLCHEEEKQT